MNEELNMNEELGMRNEELLVAYAPNLIATLKLGVRSLINFQFVISRGLSFDIVGNQIELHLKLFCDKIILLASCKNLKWKIKLWIKKLH